MIRQRLLFFVLILSMTFAIGISPVSAEASVAFQPSSNDLVTTRTVHSVARTSSVYSLPYYACALANQSVMTDTFSNLSAAVNWGKAQTNAVVVDVSTDQVVFDNMVDPYLVETLPLNGSSPLSPQAFSTYSGAVSAANQNGNAYVVNEVTGAVVWSSTNGNFIVEGGASPAPYQSLTDALNAASAIPSGSVLSMASGQTIWQAAYQVMVNGQFAQSFATEAQAQSYAEQNALSEVIDNSTGGVVWNNIPQYDVYQNGILIKQFAYESDAITYAETLTNATVEDISTQQTVYSNMPNYVVEVGTQQVQSFVDEASAIAYAQTVNGAVVIQISTNQVVWSSAGAYGVYRYLQLVRSFNTQQSAIAFAKTLDHAQVIDTQSNQVVFSNYPTNVSSPNGDTFTVQNNMLVDHWGNQNITWAPAPSFMTTSQTYVTEDYIHWYEEEPSGDVYVGSWENPYRTMNLMASSSLTASQINAFIASNAAADSVLQNTGKYFIEAEQQFGVNAQYLLAHAIIESAWGTSNFAQNRDNLFGYEAYTTNPNAAATFRSIEYDINFQAWFVRNAYLNSSGSFFNGANLDGMNVDYATDPYWSNSIARIMSEITPYAASVSNQQQLPEASTRLVFPYPPGATGLATQNITVYSAPADSSTAPSTVGNIAKGADFSVLGDTPGWDEVELSNNQTGFVDWNLVSLQNMLEVTGVTYGNTVPIMSKSSAGSQALDTVPNGVYLVMISGPTNGWDYVVDGNGKTGWITDQNVMVIH